MKPIFSKPRWIRFYLWRHLGRPIYVGQSADVEYRNRKRLQGESKGPLGKFISDHLSDCTLETLPDLAFDVSQGKAANEIENELITMFETLKPGGFNLRLTNDKGFLDGAKMGGYKVHELHPELASKCGYRSHELHKDLGVKAAEAARLANKNNPELFINSGRIGIRRAVELNPGLQSRAGKVGSVIANHNRWHRDRGVVNKNCKLCTDA